MSIVGAAATNGILAQLSNARILRRIPSKIEETNKYIS